MYSTYIVYSGLYVVYICLYVVYNGLYPFVIITLVSVLPVFPHRNGPQSCPFRDTTGIFEWAYSQVK